MHGPGLHAAGRAVLRECSCRDLWEAAGERWGSLQVAGDFKCKFEYQNSRPYLTEIAAGASLL